MTDQSKIIDRVRKLLKMANDNAAGAKHERNNALRMAHKLIAKHSFRYPCASDRRAKPALSDRPSPYQLEAPRPFLAVGERPCYRNNSVYRSALKILRLCPLYERPFNQLHCFFD